MAGSAILMTIALALLVSHHADMHSSNIWIDWRWLLRFPITKCCPPSVLLGPTQMDVLCEHRCNFRLCRILWNRTGSHPLVHRGGAVLAGTQAFSHCCVRFHKLDCQLYCGNGLPVRGGKLVNDWTWKKGTKICSLLLTLYLRNTNFIGGGVKLRCFFKNNIVALVDA